MRCQECEEVDFKELYPDPRDPPLDDGPCLCSGCVIEAYKELVQDKEDELDALRTQLSDAITRQVVGKQTAQERLVARMRQNLAGRNVKAKIAAKRRRLAR